MAVMPEDNGGRLGRVLSALGFLWAALFVVSNLFSFGGTPLGDFFAFFGSSLFFPIVLIIAGRAITRRQRTTSVEGASSSTPERSEVRTPPVIPGREPSRRPPPRQPARPVSREAEAKPTTMEDLAAAVGFEVGSGEGRGEPEVEEPVTEPEEPVSRPMSSAERIAEARRRYGKDR